MIIIQAKYKKNKRFYRKSVEFYKTGHRKNRRQKFAFSGAQVPAEKQQKGPALQ